jgi:hypothetical protein
MEGCTAVNSSSIDISAHFARDTEKGRVLKTKKNVILCFFAVTSGCAPFVMVRPLPSVETYSHSMVPGGFDDMS